MSALAKSFSVPPALALSVVSLGVETRLLLFWGVACELFVPPPQPARLSATAAAEAVPAPASARLRLSRLLPIEVQYPLELTADSLLSSPGHSRVLACSI